MIASYFEEFQVRIERNQSFRMVCCHEANYIAFIFISVMIKYSFLPLVSSTTPSLFLRHHHLLIIIVCTKIVISRLLLLNKSKIEFKLILERNQKKK